MVQQDVTNGGGGGGSGGGGVYVCHDFMGCAVSLRRSTDARVICMLGFQLVIPARAVKTTLVTNLFHCRCLSEGA